GWPSGSRLSRSSRTNLCSCRYKGCSRERQRLTPLEHPSSVSALRADPPSPPGGEGRAHLFKRFASLTPAISA
ncbi:MAG: hypothetical protein E5X49_30990, partial [Mesorhizobium sp.]